MTPAPRHLDIGRARAYPGSMKKAILLSLVLVFVSAASAEVWYQGTLDQAIAKAKSEHKLVLVDFYSYT
jgi:hypothetical protein